jgi:hypothetical protein
MVGKVKPLRQSVRFLERDPVSLSAAGPSGDKVFRFGDERLGILLHRRSSLLLDFKCRHIREGQQLFLSL